MKYLAFFFPFLLVNSIYSQGACVGTYGFSSSSTTTCVYTFTPANQTTPTIASIDWTISSSGQYGVQCDAFTNRSTLTYTFCFSGNHDVTMIVNFTGGGYCTVTNTINPDYALEK